TQEHVDDVRRVLLDAHDAVEPQITEPARRGLGREMHIQEYGEPRYGFDYGRPATPGELREMAEYSRWQAHREPTGSEERRAHSERAVRLAQLAAKPNSDAPVMVPGEPKPQDSEGWIDWLRNLPERSGFAPANDPAVATLRAGEAIA